MCFANQRSIAAYKEENWNEVCPLNTYSFWNPFSLEFFKTGKERQYQKSTYEAWHVQDFVGYCIVLATGPMAVPALSSVVPMYYLSLVVAMHFVFPPMQIYLYLKNKEAFVRYRFRSVLFVRLGLLLVFIGTGFFAEAPEDSVSGILATFLIKSPVANMVSCALIHRMEFKHHVMIHSLAFLESLFWIPLFCQTCAMDSSIMQIFNKIGYGIDWFFSYTFLNTEPDPASFPCWMISAMIMTALGFCIPTLLVYVAEVSARAVFVKSRVSHKAHSALYSYTSEAFKVGFLAFVAVVVSAWFLLTHAMKLLQ